MKWTYVINQKIKAALVITVVLLLIFMVNRMYESNFSKLQDSFVSVYEDRLLTEGYIYKLSVRLSERKQLIELQSSNGLSFRSERQEINKLIEVLIDDYQKTKLTESETLEFNEFKANLVELNLLEGIYEQGKMNRSNDQLVSQRIDQYRKLSANLDTLSEIQLLEGKRLAENSSRIVSSSKIASRLEVAVLLIVALLSQALIVTSKSLVPKFPQLSALN